MQLSSEAGDRFLRFIGMDADYLASGRSFFTVESHVNYLSQSRAGDALYVTIQLVSHDAKRLRLFTAMHRADDNTLVATAEHMMLHVDTVADKASPMDPAITATLDAITAHHSLLPLPTQAGRHIGQGDLQRVPYPLQQRRGLGLVRRLGDFADRRQPVCADARGRAPNRMHPVAPAVLAHIQHRRPQGGLLGEQAQDLLGDGVIAAGHPFQHGKVDGTGQIAPRHQPAVSSPLASREFHADQPK
jgi:acyl-CoA thioesterase FadM